MLNDPFSLIPDDGASAASLRSACVRLAQRLRESERQRNGAEMALRRIVYRRRKGLELIRDSEVEHVNAIAVRNANPLRAADSSEDAIVSAETVLHDAVTRASSLLSQVAHPTNEHRQAHQALLLSLRQVSGTDEGIDRLPPANAD